MDTLKRFKVGDLVVLDPESATWKAQTHLRKDTPYEVAAVDDTAREQRVQLLADPITNPPSGFWSSHSFREYRASEPQAMPKRFEEGDLIELDLTTASRVAKAYLVEGTRYEVSAVDNGTRVQRVRLSPEPATAPPDRWWMSQSFKLWKAPKAQPMSPIDPGKWIIRRRTSIKEAKGSIVSEALAAWCLVNSAAPLLGALISALPEPKPPRLTIEVDAGQWARVLDLLTEPGAWEDNGAFDTVEGLIATAIDVDNIEPEADRTWSLVTVQGTAIGEATLCDKCYMNRSAIALANLAAGNEEDWDRRAGFQDSTDNEAVECIVCGAS